MTEDYFPFPALTPEEDVDIGVGAQVIFRPDTRLAPALASPAQLRLGPAYGLPLLPHYPYISYSNFVPNVIHNLSP